MLDELIAQLQADPPLMPKREAAKMLSAAGEDERLGDFLPTIEEAKATERSRGAESLVALLPRQKPAGSENRTPRTGLARNSGCACGRRGSQGRKTRGLRRAVELVPKVKEELSQAWMNESFRERPERGKEILAAIGEACGQSMMRYAHQAPSVNACSKCKARPCKLLVESSPEQTESWQDALNLLAQNWMREANISLRFDRSESFGPQMRTGSVWQHLLRQ